jgi:ferric-dicitrate binding protein FerR (iron transport regulator)
MREFNDGIQPADIVMDRIMTSFGSEWNKESVHPETEFLAGIEREVARIAAAGEGAKVFPLRSRVRWSMIGLAAAACIAAVVFLPHWADQQIGSLVYGNAETKLLGASLPDSGHLKVGSKVETGEGGEALIAMDDNRINLILGQGSDLTLAKADTVNLDRGEVWVRVRPNSGFFEIRTPHGHVHIHGTTFGVAVSPDRIEVVVASGIVEVGVGEQCVDIKPGNRGILQAGSTNPTIEPTAVVLAPEWAAKILKRASEARYADFFPSVAPSRQ